MKAGPIFVTVRFNTGRAQDRVEKLGRFCDSHAWFRRLVRVPGIRQLIVWLAVRWAMAGVSFTKELTP